MERQSPLFLLTPWGRICTGEAWFYERQLIRELGAKHPLKILGRKAVALAELGSTGDVLYLLPDCRFAQVNLGFSEYELGEWANFEIYETYVDWMLAKMLPDHIEFFELDPWAWDNE